MSDREGRNIHRRIGKYARIADAAYYNQNRQALNNILQGSPETNGFRVDETLSTDEHLVLFNPDTREVVISFRGTVPSRKDVATDISIGLGVHGSTQRYRQSARLVETVSRRYSPMDYRPVQVTGHSLGGGIAVYVANQHHHVTAHVYNAAISGNELFDNRWDETDDASIIYAYSTRGDPVSSVQGAVMTHASSITNNRMRQIWLPSSNGSDAVNTHRVAGNFYETPGRVHNHPAKRQRSTQGRRPVVAVVKKNAADPQKRQRVKDAVNRGKDLMGTILNTSTDTPEGVSVVGGVVKFAKGVPTAMRAAKQSDIQGGTAVYDDKIKELTDAAVSVIAADTLLPIKDLLTGEFGSSVSWHDHVSIDRTEYIPTGQKYVEYAGGVRQDQLVVLHKEVIQTAPPNDLANAPPPVQFRPSAPMV